MVEPKRNEARPSREPDRPGDEDPGVRWAGPPIALIGTGVLMVLCCLAPVLLAGGLLGGLAGSLARLDPLWIAAAAIAGAAGLGFWLRRRAASARQCCNERRME